MRMSWNKSVIILQSVLIFMSGELGIKTNENNAEINLSGCQTSLVQKLSKIAMIITIVKTHCIFSKFQIPLSLRSIERICFSILFN